jgi:hypothetical protein
MLKSFSLELFACILNRVPSIERFFFFFFGPIYIPEYKPETKPGRSYELLHLETLVN